LFFAKLNFYRTGYTKVKVKSKKVISSIFFKSVTPGHDAVNFMRNRNKEARFAGQQQQQQLGTNAAGCCTK
jgi:hypothetical protein